MPERAGNEPSGEVTMDRTREREGAPDTTPRRNAAAWLARTHHHDFRLLSPEGQESRIDGIESQFGPFIDALLHLPVEQRMELMGMRPGVIADWGKGQHLWIEDESKW